ncbi:N-acetylglucosaminyldiphosphoundecaprenol N-acetyl-beta-D-mannosaminyltransferase [Aneurinibacillus soli]|uniref:N-acetylglucosaminyldiphosphoundecaprenol N-acetyl-beta-D-mannosaminyltransferase n=2 Tax=Aneurinibacillus soli TaxID=1500254 RepID=A0A0U5ARR7_9BACL|nr:WecB/TagA/CpsF family glycosyltransferase [Aneurinibacillus soli]PYE61548.1 N-acetylglucosaminyldiphosphoundecaprenol N-acetyl-beta-D-mannosaminyltransferase [Aneurinibacillus soli]BAU26497.1 putative N-acetylmannosaminyltransferase [Aneurinibacillus soli]
MTIQKRVWVLQVPFLAATRQETADHLAQRIQQGERMQVVTANPEIVMLGRESSSYMKLLQQADVITPDGIGVVLASRWIGEPLPERVAGYELLHTLMEHANQHGWSYVLVGASPASCTGAAETLQKMYPQAQCAGHFDGYFTPEKEKVILASIRDAKPQFLFVGLGAPRQEEWIARHLKELPVNLAMGVGGSLDVLSGTVARAPEMWQKLNLEWLYRLLSQPKRWRRQLLLPKFALSVLWNQVILRKK